MVRRLGGIAVVVVAAGACATMGEGPAGDGGRPLGVDYTVELEPGLERLRVVVCFDGPPPTVLAPPAPEAAEILGDAEVIAGRGPRREVARRLGAFQARGAIEIGSLGTGECVRYRVALGVRNRGPTIGGRLRRVGGDVLSTPRIWLLAPPYGTPARYTIQMRLPPGVQASVPWTGDPTRRVPVPDTVLRWRSLAAFGRFRKEQIELPGGRFDVAILNPEEAPPAEALREWLSRSGAAAAALYGQLPRRRIQVVVVPVPGARAAGLFGATARGGGFGIVLFVGAEATPELLARDWVAPHELSHLTMPSIADRDAWLSEGLATYYQEVLRSRAGLSTPEQAWQALADGFERGRQDGSGLTLEDESRVMHQTHAFGRVYWGGAAIGFLADVAIRRSARGAASLDTALESLVDCCLDRPRAWSAWALLRRVADDRGGGELRRVARTWLDRREFPDVARELAAIGVDTSARGAVVLRPSAEAWIRDAITARPATGAGSSGSGTDR